MYPSSQSPPGHRVWTDNAAFSFPQRASNIFLGRHYDFFFHRIIDHFTWLLNLDQQFRSLCRFMLNFPGYKISQAGKNSGCINVLLPRQSYLRMDIGGLGEPHPYVIHPTFIIQSKVMSNYKRIYCTIMSKRHWRLVRLPGYMTVGK